MSTKIEQALHEKLCAHVLGELEGAERAELERELLRSPELRAERERIAGTVGLLRESLAGESLSPGAHEALRRAADADGAAQPAGRPPPAWAPLGWAARTPWLRLAAGIGAVGLGWWIFAERTSRPDVLVARKEMPAGLGFEFDKRAGTADVEREYGQGAAIRMQAALAPAEQPGADPASAKIEVVDALGILDGARSAGASKASDYKGPGDSAPPPSTETLLKFEEARKAEQAHMARARLEPGFVGVVDTPAGQPAPAPTGGVGELIRLGYAGGGGGGTKDQRGQHFYRDDAKQLAKSLENQAPPAAGRPALAEGSASRAPASPGAAGPTSGGLAGGEKRGADLGERASKPGTDGFVRALGVENEEAVEQKLGLLSDFDTTSGDDGEALRRMWRQATPAERETYLEARCGRIAVDCLRRPNERPRDMFFRFWGDNPFEVAALDPLSTFSVDVDTASYALARRYLDEGHVPEKAQVRTEEFVNYFDSDVPAPSTGTFAVHADLTPSRFSLEGSRRMLRVIVRARDVEKFERDALRLTFVVDVSGSMRRQNRLETVKHALRMLVAQLEPRDSIAIVKFSTDASLVLPMTPVLDRAAIEAAIAPMEANGSTNSNAGLQLGYAQALAGLEPSATNRVVFLSDGVANVGETDALKILESVQAVRAKGVYLNTVGVGMENHNDVLLEQLADKGDGMCNYVDSPKEIQRALVERFTGAFQPVAKDVKIQVEFDPSQVLRYRLLGYENRAIADADFRNDAVDAGEIGAGHQVTALYEIEPAGAGGGKPMATVRLRWKPIVRAGTPTAAEEAVEAEFPVHAAAYKAYEAAPPGHRRALVVAQFAEILRRSIHARGESLDDLIREAELLRTQIPADQDFAEFCALLLRSKELVLRTVPVCDDLCETVDLLRHNHFLHATAEEAGKDQRLLEEIARTTKQLEERVKELLRRRLDAQVR